jgi:hypothetical protein
MTEPFRPDDDLVSAVLDGEATADERAQVAADPVLSARLAEFADAAERVAGPVAPRDAADRDRAIAAAVAEGHRREDVVVDLHRDNRRDNGRFLAVAAVVLLVLLAAGFLVARMGDGGGNDTAASGTVDSAGQPEAVTADTDTAGDAATSEAFGDVGTVALGAVADEEALRQALVSSGAVAPSTQTPDQGEDGTSSTSTIAPDPGASAPVPGDSEDCQIRLEEADPTLDGRLARGIAIYAGQDAVVFVYGTADGPRQVVVVSADACATLTAFPL